MDKYFEDKQGIIMKWNNDFKLKLYRQKDNLYHCSKKRLSDVIEAKEALIVFEQKKHQIVDEMKLSVQKSIDAIKDEQRELRRALEQQQLRDCQIHKLREQKLFTNDKMKIYAKIGVSQNALIEIEAIKQQNEGEIPENTLTQILCCTISLDEVDKILKQSSQFKSKKELEEDFEVIWKEFIGKVPKFDCITLNEIKGEVETALMEYVGPQGGNAKLKDMLLLKPLNNYQEELTFELSNSHFSIPGYTPPEGRIQKFFSKVKHFIYDDEYIQIVEKVTRNIFFFAIQYAKDITQRKINFTPALVNELLHYVEEIIGNEAAEQDFDIKFTNQYKHEVYIKICAFTIPLFEMMAKSFADKCDSQRYLEDFERKPLFIKYQNQFQQIETEEAVASTLCAYLEEQVINQVKKTLGSAIASKMSTETRFSDKRALKVQVLIDLLNKDDFDSYILYIKDIKTCLVEHLQKYILEYCDRKAANSHSSELQEAAFEAVIQIMRNVKAIVIKPMPDNTTLEEWLSAICLDPNFTSIGVKLATKDIICNFESSFELDRNNFQKIVRDHIEKLEEKIIESFKERKAISEMKYWDVKPDEMFKDLIGCTAQCPFCGEQCDRIHHTPKETKHYAEVHQQDCIDGWRDKQTQVMNPNVCNILVAGDGQFYRRPDKERFKFKNYQKGHPDWYIPPNTTTKSTLYWKWFTCKYEAQLLKYYNAKAMKYPNAWKNIDKAAIERDLQSVYRLYILTILIIRFSILALAFVILLGSIWLNIFNCHI